MWPTPSQQQPPKATISPSQSHSNCRPRPANMKAARQRGKWEVTPSIPFLNPDPIPHLMGQSNEAPIIVDGQKVIALIDSGAKVSNISSGFCEQMAQKVHPLDRLLKLEGTNRAAIQYLVYVEVNLQILGIRGYNEDIVLVILTMTYAKKVLVMVRSKNIYRAMGMIMMGQLAKVTVTWR